jgi:hypothetical protein
VRQVLRSGDAIWEYWVLSRVVAENIELAASVREELRRLAESPSPDEIAEEVPPLAREIMAYGGVA